jgi:hypothetical protein
MRNFNEKYPEYAAIEAHIRRAHAERSVAIAHLIASAAESAIRGIKRLGNVFSTGIADRNLHVLEIDALFRKNPAPKY